MNQSYHTIFNECHSINMAEQNDQDAVDIKFITINGKSSFGDQERFRKAYVSKLNDHNPDVVFLQEISMLKVYENDPWWYGLNMYNINTSKDKTGSISSEATALVRHGIYEKFEYNHQGERFASVKFNIGGRTLNVTSFHGKNTTAKKDEKQIAVMKILRDLHEKGNFVIGGDFNVNKKKLISWIRELTNPTEFKISGECYTCPTDCETGNCKNIDYFVYGGAIEVIEAESGMDMYFDKTCLRAELEGNGNKLEIGVIDTGNDTRPFIFPILNGKQMKDFNGAFGDVYFDSFHIKDETTKAVKSIINRACEDDKAFVIGGSCKLTQKQLQNIINEINRKSIAIGATKSPADSTTSSSTQTATTAAAASTSITTGTTAAPSTSLSTATITQVPGSTTDAASTSITTGTTAAPSTSLSSTINTQVPAAATAAAASASTTADTTPGPSTSSSTATITQVPASTADAASTSITTGTTAAPSTSSSSTTIIQVPGSTTAVASASTTSTTADNATANDEPLKKIKLVKTTTDNPKIKLSKLSDFFVYRGTGLSINNPKSYPIENSHSAETHQPKILKIRFTQRSNGNANPTPKLQADDVVNEAAPSTKDDAGEDEGTSKQTNEDNGEDNLFDFDQINIK
eukprot:TCONS_00020444-protein